MKLILLFLLTFSTSNAVTISSGELAELRANINGMRTRIGEQAVELDEAGKTNKTLSDSVGTLVLTNASQSTALIVAQSAVVTAEKQAVVLERTIARQNTLIAKQQAENREKDRRISELEDFVTFFLCVAFAFGAVGAWQLTGKFLAVSIYIRIAVSLAAGSGAAWLTYYIPTHLL